MNHSKGLNKIAVAVLGLSIGLTTETNATSDLEGLLKAHSVNTTGGNGLSLITTYKLKSYGSARSFIQDVEGVLGPIPQTAELLKELKAVHEAKGSLTASTADQIIAPVLKKIGTIELNPTSLEQWVEGFIALAAIETTPKELAAVYAEKAKALAKAAADAESVPSNKSGVVLAMGKSEANTTMLGGLALTASTPGSIWGIIPPGEMIPEYTSLTSPITGSHPLEKVFTDLATGLRAISTGNRPSDKSQEFTKATFEAFMAKCWEDIARYGDTHIGSTPDFGSYSFNIPTGTIAGSIPDLMQTQWDGFLKASDTPTSGYVQRSVYQLQLSAAADAEKERDASQDEAKYYKKVLESIIADNPGFAKATALDQVLAEGSTADGMKSLTGKYVSPPKGSAVPIITIEPAEAEVGTPDLVAATPGAYRMEHIIGAGYWESTKVVDDSGHRTFKFTAAMHHGRGPTGDNLPSQANLQVPLKALGYKSGDRILFTQGTKVSKIDIS
ncbi:MAG: hypothetical protein LBJ92_02095 [Holosporales bacterium]|jgi:hypothetical protein|nr:hypothetical protein [Holosporales bacterium]